MATVMIVGATRGIGLELVRQYAVQGDNVIACARDTSAASLLEELASSHSNVTIEQLDVAQSESVNAAAERIGDVAIDTVIVVAGVVGGMRQSIDDLDLEAWHEAFSANTIGPIMVARVFKPNLVASGAGNLMILSSQLGASTWPFGGMYIYSTTKAAVGKAAKILSIDWKEDPIIVSVMHPGYVQTDMGGPNAEITPEESASGIRSVIGNLSAEDSGNFYKWNGDIHPW
jgi:NAD(P)-dependent dehydrogenase (short-subunit alcohol dehydrogenase family)